MSKLRHILIILGVGLALITIVMMTESASPPGKITPLGIELHGLRRGAPQPPAVQCLVSNSNDLTIWVWPFAPQVTTNGAWPQALIGLPLPYAVLKPKQTVQFTVPLPTNANIRTWRVPIMWVQAPGRKEWIAEAFHLNLVAFQNGRPLPGTRIGWGFTNSWTEYSPEVAP